MSVPHKDLAVHNDRALIWLESDSVVERVGEGGSMVRSNAMPPSANVTKTLGALNRRASLVQMTRRETRATGTTELDQGRTTADTQLLADDYSQDKLSV